MTRIRTAHRLFFAAVGLFALWVGVWGYLVPTRMDEAIPWPVPPLHARFLGAMYLSGAAMMLGAILSRRWTQVRIANTMIYLWTGMLFVVSLFYLSQFPPSRIQVWFWWGAYLVYPLIAAYWAWKLRHEPPDTSAELPRWAVAYLWVQGVLVILLALALLFFPGAMIPLWPWKLTPLLAQIYSSPFLSYGAGSLLVATRPRWSEALASLVATWVFAAAVLLASWLHLALFSFAETPDRLWFIAFGIATVALGVLSVKGLLQERRGRLLS